MKINSFVFVLLFFAFSCKTKEEKFVQTEFDQLKGTWEINSITLPSSASDSLKKFFKKGEFLFYNCKYDAKKFAGSEACSGETLINESLFSLFYMYNYENRVFRLAISVNSDSPSIFRDKKSYLSTSPLLDGNWKITFMGEKLNAERVLDKEEKGDNKSINFTATRK
ncbi:MAG: hypothetical protein LCH91_11135 [Bacteroidetes bacterium]|nr:hypothetical protein [Bacteroidota bacterium]